MWRSVTGDICAACLLPSRFISCGELGELTSTANLSFREVLIVISFLKYHPPVLNQRLHSSRSNSQIATSNLDPLITRLDIHLPMSNFMNDNRRRSKTYSQHILNTQIPNNVSYCDHCISIANLTRFGHLIEPHLLSTSKSLMQILFLCMLRGCDS